MHGPDSGAIVTMQDIATAAGVSLSTVSRVLNKAPSRVPIADGTRERIEREALRLGYRPNPFARALRGAPTMLLGVVVRDFSDPFFAGALEALTLEAMARGYNVVLGHVQGREGNGFSLPSVLAPRHCDAIIVLGEMEDQPLLLAELSDAKEPVVALWQGSSPTRFPTVDVDDRKGTVLGLEHLVRRGHRHIGFVSARLPGGNPTREDSYAEFMQHHFGGVPDGYLARCESTLAGGVQALESMLRLPQVPTAIACSTDVAAVGVLHGAHSHGVVVPDGLSVVGYDDLMLAAYTIPALTTLRMPTDEIVAEAVRIAIDSVRDRTRKQPPSKTVFDPTLIVRASTGPSPP
jgi:DNA-binding LacI/PurR family transcriptional regulator